MNIPFCKPTIGKEEVRAVTRALGSGWITSGPITKEFEERFAEYVGARYAVFLNSCTAALRLAIEWHKTQGVVEYVYVPSLTFAATVNEVVQAGAEPVFGDVEDDLCLVDAEDTHYNLAIPVHLTGNVARTDYECPVIEDSAHRIERDQCKDNPNLVCFSFYATKNMTTGEGGMIATNNKDAYDWLMQARHHGISKDGWNRYKKGGAWKYDIEFVGWKANQSDILAAIGIEQLKKLPDFDKRRKDIITIYNEAFGYEHGGLHLYPVVVKNRDRFIREMAKANVQCSVHFLPVHRMSAYKSAEWLPKTDFFGDHLVSLPLYPGMTVREIDYVIDNATLTKQILPWGKTIY